MDGQCCRFALAIHSWCGWKLGYHLLITMLASVKSVVSRSSSRKYWECQGIDLTFTGCPITNLVWGNIIATVWGYMGAYWTAAGHLDLRVLIVLHLSESKPALAVADMWVLWSVESLTLRVCVCGGGCVSVHVLKEKRWTISIKYLVQMIRSSRCPYWENEVNITR